jgi:hypothetical protein
MFLAIPTNGCSLNDVPCICNDDALTRAVSACLLHSCTMADTQRTVRVQAKICNLPKESRRTQMFVYTGIVYSVGFLTMVLRIAGKIASKRLAWDDWIVVSSFMIAWVPFGCVLAMTKNGFGEHVWNLEDDMLLPILRYCMLVFSSCTHTLTARQSISPGLSITWRSLSSKSRWFSSILKFSTRQGSRCPLTACSSLSPSTACSFSS